MTGGPAVPPPAAHEPGAAQPVPPSQVRDSEDVAAGGVRVQIAGAGPGAVVVRLAGELDLATAPVAATALTGAVTAAEGGRIVLDLDQVGFLAAHGLSVILAAHADARDHGAVLALALDQAAPAAASLRFLPSATSPLVYPTPAAALAGPAQP